MRYSILLLVALCSLSTGPARGLEVSVSPQGPVASLAAARDAVRAARDKGDHSPAHIVIATGTYPLTEPVTFEPRDSDATYEAAPGAQAVFTGGRRITGWTAGAGGIWTAKVDPAWRCEGLWVNGERAQRARTPNTGFLLATGQPTKPVVASTGPANQTLLSIEPKDAAPLATLAPEEKQDVNVLVYFSWDMNRHRLAAVRPEDGTLQFTGPLRGPFFSITDFHHIRLENYRAALDTPGEWFLARDGTLSYWPRRGENPGDPAFQAWAPVAPQWLVVRGDPSKKDLVHDLTFRGLSFEHQAWSTPPGGAFFGQAEHLLISAVEADGAKDVLFENCEFARTMTNALWFRRGCENVTVKHCHLHDLGAGGVKIGDPNVTQPGPNHTHHVRVENCIIQSGGRVFPGACGVTIFHASDCTLRHCDIGDLYYTAVSIGWTWGYQPNACARNVVEYCNLHHLGWGEMSDMGAVYTLGPQPGTVIRHCRMHDIGCAAYGGWGMYNDEGSTGIVWEDNLVERTQSGGYHQHYGRGNVIRNNIFAFSKETQIRRSRAEAWLAFTFEQNIVIFSEGSLLGVGNAQWLDGRVSLSRNVYWRSGGQPFDFAGKSWEEWRLLGNDTESLVADPLFGDPAKGNYTLPPESPALKIGFRPFDPLAAGVEGEEAWHKLAAKDFGPMRYGVKPPGIKH